MNREHIRVYIITPLLSNMKQFQVYLVRCVRKSTWKLVKWLLCIGLVVVYALSVCPSDSQIVGESSVPCKTGVPEEVIVLEVIPEEKEYIDLGICRITAYCSCEKCCGEWALNRPNGIVYGAEGTELIAGVSCASPLPFGTTLEIEGLGQFVVQDRMAQWVLDKYGDNCVDIYFDSHEDSLEFALQYFNVKVVN